jgi:hypothetical protein
VSVATQDMRGMSDEELRELFASDEAASALAEAERRDQADQEVARLRARTEKARQAQRAIQDEWYEAAYEQYLAASRACRGSLLSREGMAHGPRDEFGLWSHRTADAMRWASDELREFWETWPRVSLQAYTRQRAAAIRAAKADKTAITEEAGNVDRVGTDRRAGLDADDARGLRRDGGSGAVRDTGDTRVTEAGTDGRERAGSVQPGRAGGRVNGCKHPHRIGTSAQCGNCPAKTLTGGGETVNIASEAATGARVAANVDRHMAAGREAAERRLAAARAGAEMTGTVVRRPATPPARPRADAIPGDQLLELLRKWIGTYARFPSPAALDLVTLWAAHTHVRDEEGKRLLFRATPRLWLLSNKPGSGKSRVLELLNLVCPEGYGLSLEATAAGLVKSLKNGETFFIDEADILFNTGKRHSSVRSIMNGGYTSNGTYLTAKGREPCFGPIAMAGLDVLEKDTGEALSALLSRGFKIRMRKSPKTDRPAKITRQTEVEGAKLKDWLGAWAAQIRDSVPDAEPVMPDELDTRAEQISEPLVIVGDAAWTDTVARAERDGTPLPEDGGWAGRSRDACIELALAQDAAPTEEDESPAEAFASFATDLAGSLAGAVPEEAEDADNWEE